MQKIALVCGAGGFIGGHLVKRLLQEGYRVVGVDIKPMSEWYQVDKRAFNHFDFDLRDQSKVDVLVASTRPEEVYQLASDMGGAGYIFTGEHDADVMHNSAMINLNLAFAITKYAKEALVFYSSSACIYPQENQLDPSNPNCEESTAYPANPDSEYGWEKLFSERLWRSYSRNYGLNVRIARFHNIFGPHGTWVGGKEKAPAAMCRKALNAVDTLEIWGPGTQTRSFLYIDDCLEGVRRLMKSDVEDIVNIGSSEMISITGLAEMALCIAQKTDVKIINVKGPIGVMGRCSDNTLIKKKLGWEPTMPLEVGMIKTLNWISEELQNVH